MIKSLAQSKRDWTEKFKKQVDTTLPEPYSEEPVKKKDKGIEKFLSFFGVNEDKPFYKSLKTAGEIRQALGNIIPPEIPDIATYCSDGYFRWRNGMGTMKMSEEQFNL